MKFHKQSGTYMDAWKGSTCNAQLLVLDEDFWYSKSHKKKKVRGGGIPNLCWEEHDVQNTLWNTEQLIARDPSRNIPATGHPHQQELSSSVTLRKASQKNVNGGSSAY